MTKLAAVNTVTPTTVNLANVSTLLMLVDLNVIAVSHLTRKLVSALPFVLCSVHMVATLTETVANVSSTSRKKSAQPPVKSLTFLLRIAAPANAQEPLFACQQEWFGVTKLALAKRQSALSPALDALVLTPRLALAIVTRPATILISHSLTWILASVLKTNEVD